MREALRDRAMLRWLGVTPLVDPLDELFLAFAALYLRDHMLLPASVVSLALLALLAGVMAGLLALDRVARHGRGEHLLPGLLLLVAGSIAAFLAAPALPLRHRAGRRAPRRAL